MAESAVSANDSENDNNSPIIGVLAQEIAYSLDQIYPGEYKSFIAASYVKFVEGGGARVVPVWIGRNKEYYADIINKTNGILFPGGATWFNQSNGYADAGYMIYNLAVQQNQRGHHYPLFGICLGMEFLIYAAAGATEYRADCSAQNIGLPLEFKPDFKNSKMFESAPEDIIESLKTRNITSNFHRFCLTEQCFPTIRADYVVGMHDKKFPGHELMSAYLNLTDLNLANDWHVLSVNKDVNGFEFVSTLEHRQYPFFGVQFHPEKHIYEWKPKKGVSHTKEAIQAAQYFAELFVNSARKSNNRFESREAEMKELIYNYPAKYTGRDGSSYEQCYLFKEEEDIIQNDIPT